MRQSAPEAAHSYRYDYPDSGRCLLMDATSRYPGESDLRKWQDIPGGPRSFVYVISGPDAPPIKVGVAKDPIARMANLQQGNPARLRLLFVLPGGYDLEADFHRRLEECGIRGEWFGGDQAAAFLGWIEEAARRAFTVYENSGNLPSALPPLRPITRAPLRTYGYRRREIGHIWRTSNGSRQNSVTVRYVDPLTLVPDPKRQAERERSKRNAAVLGKARSEAFSPFNPEADKLPQSYFGAP